MEKAFIALSLSSDKPPARTVQVGNPLLNDLVLEELSKYITVHELHTFRLVCKKWNRSILPRFRTTFEIFFDDGDFNGRLKRFVALMTSTLEVPFGKFFLSQIPMREKLVEEFFLLCGHAIRELSLQMSKEAMDICHLRELLLYRAPYMEALYLARDNDGIGIAEEITNHGPLFPRWTGLVVEPMLPKLRILQFNAERQAFHTSFLTDLLKATPNLQDVDFRKYTDVEGTTTFLQVLETTDNYVKLKKLTLGKLENYHLQTLVKLSGNGLRLKALNFEILAASVTNRAFEAFLQCQNQTLESLQVNEYMGTRHLYISVPVMRNLRRLTRTALSKYCQIRLGTICFSAQFPKLEEYTVTAFADELDWNEYYSPVENMRHPCTTLRKLELPMKMTDPGKIQILSKMFPNVTDLQANLPACNILPYLWEAWPGLEMLEIFLSTSNENLDAVFTGVPVEECARLLKSQSFAEVDVHLIRSGPTIANLRKLRKFRLEASPKEFPEESSYLLSDVTGYLVLSRMTHLEELMITATEMTLACYLEIIHLLPKHSIVKIGDVNCEWLH